MIRLRRVAQHADDVVDATLFAIALVGFAVLLGGRAIAIAVMGTR